MIRHVISNVRKRILYSLIYLMLILELVDDIYYAVLGYDCFTHRFPLILGFDSGDTVIQFID